LDIRAKNLLIDNLRDGRVELAVEGEESEIERFVADLTEAMKENIQKIERAWRAPTAEEKDFRVHS
jgi:acylphosphatase